MAKVIVVDKYDSNIKVFKTSDQYDADLLVKIVSDQYDAKEDQFWFFVNSTSDATSKISWVDSSSDADLKVFLTDDRYAAGWKKAHNYQNRL